MRVVRLRGQVHRRPHHARRAGDDRDEATTARVREIAAEVFDLADCAGLARCDFFVEPDGRVLLNEVNTMPGFTKTSVYGKLWSELVFTRAILLATLTPGQGYNDYSQGNCYCNALAE